MDILLEIEGQEYVVFFAKEPSLQELKEEVQGMCKKEDMVRGFDGRIPVFSCYNEKFQKWTQLHSKNRIRDGDIIRVTFETPPQPVTSPAIPLAPEETNTAKFDTELVTTGEGMVQVTKMKSDGKCLLYALTHQLHPESFENFEKFNETVSKLRHDVVTYIKSNMPEFKATLLMSVEGSMLDYKQKTPKGRIDGFIRNLENGKEWGGYETLVACSKIKNVQIKVLQEVWRGDVISAKSIIIESASDEQITIVYRMTQDPEALKTQNPGRNHYDSFLKFIKEKNHDENAESTFHSETTDKSAQNKTRSDNSHINPDSSDSEKMDKSKFIKEKNHDEKAESTFHSEKTDKSAQNKTRSDNSDINPDSSDSEKMHKSTERKNRGDKTDMTGHFDSSDNSWNNTSLIDEAAASVELSFQSNESTDSEQLEYYQPGVWNRLSKHHKQSEKKRWKLHLEKEKSGDVMPFQAILSSPVTEGKTKRKRNCLSSTDSSSKETEKTSPIKMNTDHLKIVKETDEARIVRRIVCSDEEDTQNLSGEEKDKSTKKKKYRRRQQVKRDINMQITPNNCMPEFSPAALESLEEGNPDYRTIMPDIRRHINGLIGDDYPTRKEYDILASSLIKKYKCLADADNPRGFETIKLKIRKALSQKTLYRNKKEAKTKENKTIVVIRDKITGPSESEMDKELREGEQVDDTRTKFLITKTYQLRHASFRSKEGVEEVIKIWLLYPHLMNFQMLSYEYTLVLRLTAVDIRTNIEKTMEKLREYFNISEMDKMAEISILEKVFNETTPIKYRKIGMVPALDVRDEDVVRDGFCQDQSEKNSPRVLVITRFVDLKDSPIWSYVLSSGKVLSKCENPGGLEVAIQLLASYFLMDLKYPDPYKSFLRFLEKSANGGLCLQTAKQRPHETYNKFMRATGLQEQL